ncbi:hypothetical protein [Streptomyces sp. A0958]|uniref:hypothetical protein n=1 Tax=Streptomyces sp. A0958 TaxID=2563101 RepID=UPI001447FE35|nr:hypothetical protein [Streptomyces sp. A0958]
MDGDALGVQLRGDRADRAELEGHGGGQRFPTLLLPPGTEATDGLRTYAELYAARALPLAAALAHVLRTEHRALAPVLAVAGAAQLGDAYIGVERGITGMAAGGTLAAAVHLASAWWLTRRTGGEALRPAS